MLINNKYNRILALQVTGKNFLIFLSLAILIALLGTIQFAHDHLFFAPNLLAIFGSGVGVFLAFRINSGYDRWWEARKIWGEMVNISRSFGMNITAMLTKTNFSAMTEEEKTLQKKIIFRHIAFINALRLHLRQNEENIWEDELWNKTINGEYLIDRKEIKKLKKQFNIPTQLLQKQSQEISAFFDGDPIREFRYLKLMDSLKIFYDIQGKSERIKNTVFPWGYAYYTHRLVWLMAFVIPFGFVVDFSAQQIVLSAIISTIFITVEQVGRNLDNPFDNSFNDTPLSALCRSIEIDLLEQLGEERTKPILPKMGVLD